MEEGLEEVENVHGVDKVLEVEVCLAQEGAK